MNKSDMRLFIELLKERCAARQREILLLKQLNERLKEAQSCSLIKESGQQLNNMLLHKDNDNLRIENDRLKAQMSEIGKALIARNDRLNRAFWEVAVGFYRKEGTTSRAKLCIYYGREIMENTRNATQQ